MVTSPLARPAKKNKVEQSSWLERDEGDEEGDEGDNQSVVREKEKKKGGAGGRESAPRLLGSSSSPSPITRSSDVCLLQLEMFPSLHFPLRTSPTPQMIV